MCRPYVRTVALKGLPRRVVVVKHVLRNALLPTITVIAISFGWLIGGIIVIENVFSYPGPGRLLLFAIDRRDVPLMQAIAIVVVLGVVFADLQCDVVNPRIRYNVRGPSDPEGLIDKRLRFGDYGLIPNPSVAGSSFRSGCLGPGSQAVKIIRSVVEKHPQDG